MNVRKTLLGVLLVCLLHPTRQEASWWSDLGNDLRHGIVLAVAGLATTGIIYYLLSLQSVNYSREETETLDDIIGLDGVVKEASEFVTILQDIKRYKELGGKPPRGLLLEGVPGADKALVARAIAGELHAAFLSISGSQLVNWLMERDAPGIDRLLQVVLKLASNPLKHVVLFIDDFDALVKSPELARFNPGGFTAIIKTILVFMDRLKRDEHVLIIAATNNCGKLDSPIRQSFSRSIYIPLPDEEGRKKILSYYIKTISCDLPEGFVDEFATKCNGFSELNLKNLVNEAVTSAIKLKCNIVNRDCFLDAYTVISPFVQRGFVDSDGEDGYSYTFSERTRFSDVLGVDGVVKEAQEFVDVLNHPERYAQIKVSRPRGLLLYGQPGTGKTLLARAIAGEANCCFISASASQFVKIYVGAGPLAVRKLFSFARSLSRKKPVVIFLDEIDALGRRSHEVHGGDSEYRNTLNEMLIQMDGFAHEDNIYVVAATNAYDLIDPALLREGRFDKKIEISLPSIAGRQDILAHYLKKVNLDPQLVVADVAKKYAKETIGYSGAALEALVKKAAFNAAYQGAEFVKELHIDAAYVKGELGVENNRQLTKEELTKVAYHEAGHALISLLTGHEVPRVSILARSNTLGVAFRNGKHEEFSSNSKNDLLQLVMISLGGLCAESLMYDQQTGPGVSSDLEHANKLAFEMVNTFGMGDGNFQGVIGKYCGSDKTREEFDRMACSIVQQCRIKAFELLKAHKEELQKITEALLVQEVLTWEDLKRLVP